jgi:hypothetical protein
MAEFSSSTQVQNWMMPSLEAFKTHVKKAQKNIMQRIDKFTTKAKPI